MEIRSITAPRQSDLTIARLSEAGIYRTERHIHIAHEEAKAGQSPEALVQTHERRLEALRRAGIVDRLDAGVWRVPLDLAERGLQYDVKASGGVEVNVLSALPIGRQVSAIGATSIDRQMLDKANGIANHGFGDDTRQAIRQRTAYLLDAMLDDGVGFSLMPWRPAIDRHLGMEIRGVSVGSTINWDFSRARGLGR